MKTRKNIDRLYHEKLKDVETTPREDMWKNIAARLPEKGKKKRIIPIWLRIAGAAAVVALLVGVGNSLLNPSENNYINVDPSPSFTSTSTKIKKNFIKTNPVSTDFKENMYSTVLLLQSLITETQSESEKIIEDAQTPGKTQILSHADKNLFADIIKPSAEIILDGPKYTFADYNTVAFTEEERQKENNLENTAEKQLKDLKLLASKEEEEPKELSLPSNRLSVGTTAAAVYFDNLGTGNTINSQFGDNESKGEVSLAYGINLAYQISKKVKIRSGINKVAFSQNTKDVDYSAAVTAIAVNNEQPRYNSPNSPVQGGGQLDSEFAPLISPRITGELNQQMGFIEVPLEIEYAIIDKQIGLNIIGGASTLFLNDNMITLNSPEASNHLGEAQNLNDVSFTTNIGLGIDYNISPRFELNLEPIFKYQMNTFNNNKDLKPYYFGVYSGFSFKF